MLQMKDWGFFSFSFGINYFTLKQSFLKLKTEHKRVDYVRKLKIPEPYKYVLKYHLENFAFENIESFPQIHLAMTQR